MNTAVNRAEQSEHLEAVDIVFNGGLQPALLRVDHEAYPRGRSAVRQRPDPPLHGLQEGLLGPFATVAVAF